MSDRDCIHGSLARSCERCALEAEIDRLQERVATLESRLATTSSALGKAVKRADAATGHIATLEGGILAKCEQWEAEQPDALAYEVTDSFRRLLDEEADR